NKSTTTQKQSQQINEPKQTTKTTITPEKSTAINFTQLNNQINIIKNNGTKDKNYSIKLIGTNYDFTDRITWDGTPSNLTLIGDSNYNTKVVLNGMNNGISMFYIISGHSITFINITIVNGRSSESNIGGAITNHGIINLINASIQNNTHVLGGTYAHAYGGAIYNTGTINSYNSVFEGNNVTTYDSKYNPMLHDHVPNADVWSYGGAIYNTGTINCNNTTFNKNSAVTSTDSVEVGSYSHSYGGAIYNNGIITIINSLLIENQAYANAHSDLFGCAWSYGGAIHNNGTITIHNTILNKNYVKSIASLDTSAGSYGGAIYNNKIMEITKSSLIGNQAYTLYATMEINSFGGAIYNRGKLSISNLDLINNSVYSKFVEFGSNNGYGGAIFTTKYMHIINTRFINNSANCDMDGSAYGGAIYTENGLKVTNSIFINNTALNKGNDIYSLNKSCNYSIENNWWGNNTLNWNQSLTNINQPQSWIYLKLTTIKNNINVTENTQVKCDFNWKTDGKNITTYKNSALDNTLITYDLTNNIGKITPITTIIQNGTGITTFTGIKSGTETINLKAYNFKTNSITNITINPLKSNTKITYITPIINPGSNITIKATITNTKQENIKQGGVVIKINGKTLKDDYGQAIKIPVTNGTITYTYTIPEDYSTKKYNLTVKYLETEQYSPSEQTINFTITKTQTKTTIETIQPINPGNNLTIKANITDKNNKPVTTGYVILKINGKTLKDAKGNVIKVNVNNGKIAYNYTIPKNYSTKKYNLTVKYMGNNQNTQSEQIINFTITKAQPTITKIETISPIKAGNNLLIKANITDKNNKPVTTGYVI
ncbi:MAG: hypothetical protein Q4Q23_08050, partial [Methanobacteriaceae archaeon]|nr:hypothetical protein [Methanobacteriaceae archaeon]